MDFKSGGAVPISDLCTMSKALNVTPSFTLSLGFLHTRLTALFCTDCVFITNVHLVQDTAHCHSQFWKRLKQ